MNTEFCSWFLAPLIISSPPSYGLPSGGGQQLHHSAHWPQSGQGGGVDAPWTPPALPRWGIIIFFFFFIEFFFAAVKIWNIFASVKRGILLKGNPLYTPKASDIKNPKSYFFMYAIFFASVKVWRFFRCTLYTPKVW